MASISHTPDDESERDRLERELGALRDELRAERDKLRERYDNREIDKSAYESQLEALDNEYASKRQPKIDQIRALPA